MYLPFDYNLALHLDFPLRSECADGVILGPSLLVSSGILVFFFFRINNLTHFLGLYIPFRNFGLFLSAPFLFCSVFVPFPLILKKVGIKHLVCVSEEEEERTFSAVIL